MEDFEGHPSSMALKDEVFIRPVEISFSKNACQSFDPVGVLIVSRSARILRFKGSSLILPVTLNLSVFSTSRSKYSLSKCRGVLQPGGSVRM